MNVWWVAAVVAGFVAIAAGLGDWRRSKRRDLDSIGWVDWRTLQMFALIAAACCAIVATHNQ